MKSKFQKLANLGAGEFEHLDGTLIDHLMNTMELLKEWGAISELQDAGLFHAAYGTAGFDERMISLERRRDIAKIIGIKSEEIVYEYCACDRSIFFSRLGNEQTPVFKNRFSGEEYYLSDEMLTMFCELTAANEVEISIDNSRFKAEYGPALNELFLKMAPYLSNDVKAAVNKEFGGENA